MSDTVIIALVAGIPGAFTALAALIVSMQGNKKVDGVRAQGAEIHDLVNGTAATLRADLATALTRIDELQALVDRRRKRPVRRKRA